MALISTNERSSHYQSQALISIDEHWLVCARVSVYVCVSMYVHLCSIHHSFIHDE